MKTYTITLTFTTDLLGTVAKDPNVYASHIATKKGNLTTGELAEELDTVPDAEVQGWTGFHTLPNGRPILYDYVIKGFFKDACSMLRRVGGSRSSKITAYRKEIDGLVFIQPRQIPIRLSAPMTVNERPLRASTAQGERIALARSDVAPAGSSISFVVEVLGGKINAAALREWFEYGERRGLGQWRNAGWGSFTANIQEGDILADIEAETPEPVVEQPEPVAETNGTSASPWAKARGKLDGA